LAMGGGEASTITKFNPHGAMLASVKLSRRIPLDRHSAPHAQLK
jgi:hypothetical protein